MEEKKKISIRKFPRWMLFVSASILGLILLICITGYFVLSNSVELSSKLQSFLNLEVGKTQPKEPGNIVLSQSEKNTVDIVKDSKSAVVSVAISKISLSKDSGVLDQSSNIGTGFVIDAQGLIITNQHVVSDLQADYKVVTNDGKEYTVNEIIRDDLNDIALLKIEAKDLAVLKLGNSDNLVVGQDVIAIGTPLGEYAGSVTKGIVSGLNRTVSATADWFGTTAKTYEDVIQTDAAVNPGNSGGPLINSQGEVVGINFATTSGANSISFAIPINKVKTRISEYRTYGKFIRPYLGVSYQMISEYEALYFSDVVAGALIQRVESNGPAFKAGIKRADIITYFGGEKVTSSLSVLIQKHKVGDEVEVKISRDGKEVVVKVTLVEMD